jgi:serine/threonine protein kinase
MTTLDKTPVPFGRFVLLGRIAEGGMGEIQLAAVYGPQGFQKLLAIKRVKLELADDPNAANMFFSEARISAGLNHSNIVQIYEMGRIDNRNFIAMEFVHGKSLRALLKALPETAKIIPGQVIVHILRSVCEGLGYAHNATDATGEPLRIIHRDISPENVLLGYNGDVKLIDFGVARSDEDNQNTRTGVLKGKAQYMSPEQAQSQPIDHRSDIFSLGVCLYEMCTGTNPFNHGTLIKCLNSIIQDTPPPVSSLVPELAMFDPVINRALAKTPEERFQSCNQLASALLETLPSGERDLSGRVLKEVLTRVFGEEARLELNRINKTAELASSGNFIPPPSTDSVTIVQGPDSPDEPVRLAGPSPGSNPAMQNASVVAVVPRRMMVAWFGLTGFFGVCIVAAVVWLVWGRAEPRVPAVPVGTDPVQVAQGKSGDETVNASTANGTRPDSAGEVVVVDVSAEPAEASIYVNGRMMGVGRASLQLPKTTDGHIVRVTAAGYIDRELIVQDSLRTQIVLDKVTAAKAKTRPPDHKGSGQPPTKNKAANSKNKLSTGNIDPWAE